MAVRKRGNSWQIDVLVPTGQRDEEGREIKERYRKTFKKKKDAEAEHDKIKTLVREKRFLDVKKDYRTRLNELIEKYEENFKHQAGFEAKSYYLKSIREYFGGDTLLSNIRYMDLETFRNILKRRLTRRGTIRTDAAVNREMACLRHMLGKAAEWEMIDISPFEKGKSLQFKENNRRTRYLLQDEIDRLLEECRPKKLLYRVVICALNTGMRRKEILTLKWSQVRNGFIYLEETKTKERREIPINKDLAEVFKGIRKEQGLASKFVFSKAGKETKRIEHQWWAALKRAGIEDFKFHDLRHTFASHLIMKGASLKEVQELLGHKGITMTMRYAHLAQEQKQKAVNLLNGLTTRKMSQNVTNSESRLANPL
jgi:integrase